MLRFVIGFSLLMFFQACKEDKVPRTDPFEVKIRVVEEPDRLHPMLSVSAVATQIENHIFLPLMEFDPETLEMIPVLVQQAPHIEKFRDGKRFDFEISEKAHWQDGAPVVANDYVFTVKAALNPHTRSTAWRGLLNEIDSIAVDADNPRKFSVFVDNPFHLALETVSNFGIYPEHYYDSGGLLKAYSMADMKSDSLGGKAALFAKQFNAPVFSRDSVMGSGPYQLEDWQTNLSIRLKKVEDYGLDYPKAFPDRLIYLVVPDEATALSMLKGGQLDIVSSVSPPVFNELKAEGAPFFFQTPSLMQYYFLALNMTSDKLEDFRVRRALAHLLDLQQLSEILMGGLAEPVAGPVHPSKSYYNTALSIIPYDTVLAARLLEEAGWSDSDGDGIRDQMIKGENVSLDLDILVTQRELGRNLARILKESARKVGININIISLEWSQILNRISSRDFDLIAMAKRQAPGLDDFYQSWHSESIGPNGRNICGFSVPEADRLIFAIRTAADERQRREMYLKMQEIIYETQPVIFLFAPTETIVYNKDLEMVISPRRPGYFESTARRR